MYDLHDIGRAVRSHTPTVMDTEREYAVLVPLVRRGGELHLLYEVRARTLRRQPGEVCFPGGRMEQGETPVDCALRETREELGIPASAIQVIGPLDFIAHRANFLLYPILALVDFPALDPAHVSAAEVDSTFTCPLPWLLTTVPEEYPCRLNAEFAPDFPYEKVGIPRTYTRQPGWDNIPVYFWGGHAIWGLTARITRHLVTLLRENKTESERNNMNGSGGS